MIKERFSNLTVLNSHKERTAKLAPTPLVHFKRGGHRPPQFKNCSADPEAFGTEIFYWERFFSVTDTSDSEETVPSRLPIGDEPMTFWLLVQMLNHLATGDLWEPTAKAISLLLKTAQWRCRWRWCIRWFRCGYPKYQWVINSFKLPKHF